MDNDGLRQKFIGLSTKTDQLILEFQKMTKPVAAWFAIGRISKMGLINDISITDDILAKARTIVPN